MRAIVTAMTWEYWRRGWPSFLGVLVYMIGIPLSIAGVEGLQRGTSTRSGDIDTLPLHCIFLWLGFCVFCSAVLAAQGERKPSSQSKKGQMFPARLYALPASAWLIVGCRTLQGVVTVAVLFLVTTTAYKLAFDVNWPILGPMLFLSMAFVCLQAGTWSVRDFRFWKLGIYVLVLAALIYWLMQR